MADEKTLKWAWSLAAVISIVIAIVVTVLLAPSSGKKENEVSDNRAPARAAERSEVIIWSDPQQIKVSADRWSETSSVPSGKFGIAVQKGEKAEVLFSSGKYYLLDNYKQVEFGNASGSFQFRGINKDVVIYIYTAS